MDSSSVEHNAKATDDDDDRYDSDDRPLGPPKTKKPRKTADKSRTEVTKGKQAFLSMEHNDINKTKPSVIDVIEGPTNTRCGKIMHKCKMYDGAGGKGRFWEENRYQTQL